MIARTLAVAAAAWLAAGCSSPGSGPPPVRLMVFAAASLEEVAGELARLFEDRERAAVELNVAGSDTLARQILAAPGADVFLSADLHWVELLERRGRVVEGSRRPLLGNRLVLIGRMDSPLRLERAGELATAGFSHLALADPEVVPAGRYAAAALRQVDVDGGTLWQAVAPRVVPALDVRAALALVESDPRILGVVYATDARRSRRVRVLAELPASGAARVTYYGALLADGEQPSLGRRFLDLAAGGEGRDIAGRYGFEAPPS